MRQILCAKGAVALVDDEDYEALAAVHWRIDRGGYVFRYQRVPGTRRRRTLSMHRVIMAAKPGQFVDHSNRDKLDNRRSNLRFCTKQQNSFNRGDTTGVCWKKSHRCWHAQININRQTIHLGHFKTWEAARAARVAAEAKYFGEFAPSRAVAS